MNRKKLKEQDFNLRYFKAIYRTKYKIVKIGGIGLFFLALIMLFINWRLSLAFSLFGSFIIFVLLPPLKLLINALTDQTKFPIFIKSIKKSTLIITFIGTLWLIITNIVIISPELSLEIKLFLFTVGYFFSGLTFYFFTPKFFLWLFRRYGLNIYKEEK